MSQNVGYLGEFSMWAEKNVYSAVVIFYKCQLNKLIDIVVHSNYILTDFVPTEFSFTH